MISILVGKHQKDKTPQRERDRFITLTKGIS